MRFLEWLQFLIEDESGFLGFGGGQRKKDALKTQAAARGIRTGLQPMIDDPTKRGFSPATLMKMKGQAAEPISGARTSMQRALQRSIAAQGMGGTGMYNRAILQSTPRFTEALRSSTRDIDIAGEQAGREDLWNAYQMQLGTFNPEMAAQQQAHKSMWGPALAGLAQSAIGGFGGSFGAAAGKKAFG